MSIGVQVLTAKLGNPYFAETVKVRTDAHGEDYEFTARVIRFPSQTDRIDDKKTRLLHRAEIQCLATVHATYGGLVSPQFGSFWTFPLVRGGTPVFGWKAGVPSGGDGLWRIEVKYEEIQSFGSKKQSER